MRSYPRRDSFVVAGPIYRFVICLFTHVGLPYTVAMVVKFKDMLPAIAEDVFSSLQIPGGSTVSQLLQGIFRKKAEEAREILLDEIKNGCSPALAEDEVVYITYRYLRAAQEGAARINLRLLAQIIAGDTAITSLTADRFLYYSDIIASLTIDEIKLLGMMLRDGATSWSAGHGWRIDKGIRDGFSDEKTEALLQSMLRTGLVILSQEISVDNEMDWKISRQYDARIYTSYHLTPLMEELAKFVSFEAALDKEK